MPRTFYIAVGCLLATTLRVAAQPPGDTSAGPRSSVARATAPRIDAPRILPGTRPDVFSTIQGNALTSTNSSLPNATVRLRDARIGQIIETQVTDQTGLFAFRSIDPGSYIVEIIAEDRASVLAASQVLSVSAGEAVSAVVKLPFKLPPFAGVLGSSTPTAAAVAAQAASAGVLATQVQGAPTCDTLQ